MSSSAEISPVWFEEQLTLKGLTRAGFAAYSGVSTTTLAKVARGDSLRVDTKLKIVIAFNRLPDIKGMAEATGRAS